MEHAAEFRRCLVDLDVPAARALWAHACPHLPQPATDGETLATLHRARTTAQSVPLRARAYSHAWLIERGIPSGLPDELRPAAERMYPTVTSAVGVSINFRSPDLKPVAVAVERAVTDAVREVYADGRGNDTPLVRVRMQDARRVTIRRLLGTAVG